MSQLTPPTDARTGLAGYLLDQGLVSRAILDAALAEQRVTGDTVGAILVRNGFLARADLHQAEATEDFEESIPEAAGGTVIPVELLERYSIIVSYESATELQLSTLVDEVVVRAAVEPYCPNKTIRFVNFVPDQFEGFLDTITREQRGLTKRKDIDQLVHAAIAKGASDIHIVPRPSSCSILFRLLGVRRLMYDVSHEQYQTIVAQIKDRASLDLAERRLPQDGRFEVKLEGRSVDLRVATVPSIDGEIVVVRILDAEQVAPVLDRLGLSGVDEWREAVNQRNGLCLVCGPTGSGKTTTLNATLREMDRLGKAVYSIEDPVEYRVSYAGQVNVNPAIKLDFAQTVRAFMRADPDVIVLGEIRDEETAKIAVRAADTGHIVLATLHTGSVVGAIDRLRNLGVSTFDLANQLRVVMVQTLLRTVCPACRGAGCVVCHDLGYGARTAASECARFDEPEEVAAAAKGQRSWPSLFEDATAKYQAGLTTAAELRRVFGSAADAVIAPGVLPARRGGR